MPSQWIAFSSKTRNQGFTLVELMIVLAIIAIVAAVAAPDYRSSMESSRVTSATNQLLGTLQFARSEAVAKRLEVTVCPSDNQADCSGSWADGAVVLDENDNVLRVLPASDAVVITGNAVTFTGEGRSTASVLNITKGSTSKQISINIVGHAKIN